MIQYKELEDGDRVALHQIALSTYLDGECYAFAIALHRELGWPIRGVMEGAVIRHVVVEHDDAYWDVRGKILPEKLGAPFGLSAPYTIVPVTPEDLFAVRPIHEQSIARVVWIAQAIWPELPWKQGPLVKYRAFLEELEELSRKHGVYIFAQYPAAWPVLTESHRDEKGYVFSPSMIGRSYMFDRVLE